MYEFKIGGERKKNLLAFKDQSTGLFDEDMTSLSDNLLLHHTMLAIQQSCVQEREGHSWTNDFWTNLLLSERKTSTLHYAPF